MSHRPSWDEYFMTITRQVAERSTCLRAKVGAVIVRDRNILATGYNGAPAGLPHCLDVGCLIYRSQTPTGESEENCFRTIHAEINAIAQAAKNGAAIRDAAIYITHTPVHSLLQGADQHRHHPHLLRARVQAAHARGVPPLRAAGRAGARPVAARLSGLTRRLGSRSVSRPRQW